MGQPPEVTRSEIRAMFDRAFYQRGKTYYETGRVVALKQGEADEPDARQWNAKVQGKRTYAVIVTIGDDYIHGSCSCPSFANYDACKHVVAVLIALADAQKARVEVAATTVVENPVAGKSGMVPGPQSLSPDPVFVPNVANAPSKSPDIDSRAVLQLMELFRTSADRESHQASVISVDGAEMLRTEWHISVSTGYYESIALSVKVGPKSTYVVRKIRDFLDAVNERQKMFFTTKFSYLPDVHRFHPDDVEILRVLTNLMRDERTSRGYSDYSYASSADRDRWIKIPPSQWGSLYPLLARVNATVAAGQHQGSLRIEDTPPISVHIARRDEGDYILSLQDIHRTQLLRNYGCALLETTFFPLDAVAMEQIAGLQQILGLSKREEIAVPAEALSPLVNEVLPKLRHVGHITVDEQISERIIEAPLTVKLYLDLSHHAVVDDGVAIDGDALIARVEFVYGDVTVSPAASHFADASSSGPTTGLDDANGAILLRDRTGEDAILRMLGDALFVPDEDQFMLAGENNIYTFLFYKLADLQAVAEVYATAAVDAWTKPSPSARTRLDLDTGMNWLEVSFDIAGLDASDIRAVLQSLMERKKYHRLRDGSFIPLDQGTYAELSTLLDDLAIADADLRVRRQKAVTDAPTGADVGGLTLKLPALRALPLMDEPSGQHVKLGRALRQWLDDLRHPENLDFPLPADLRATLREYQVYGFQWLKTLTKYGFGGILADDMGLGKTIQSIAFLLSHKAESVPTSPALIVCPASLTYNWLREMETFAPSLKAVVVSGDKTERQRILTSANEYDILVTSYPLLRRDETDYARQTFSTVILDEAQAIKNHTTQTAAAVRAVHSDRRIALTGTPIENSLDDLWSIFHTVFGDVFGSHKSFSALSPEQVAKRVKPFILRRLKQDVLAELPDKIETLHTSELTREQKKLYLAYLARLQQETMEGLTTEGFQKGRLRILAGLTRLRQICCHPSLCVENYQDGSGKLDQLLELVDEHMAAGGRMLIFSQFTSMLQIIRKELVRQGLEHFYLDGKTPVDERLQLCQSFNEGLAPVFLISLKAGGTGLNLTGADTVILYDLWWNPAVEQQAADRAHRIGQKRTVQVIRMVTQGTIEEKMYELQQRKRGLIDTVIQAGGDGFSALTEEDVRELLAISD